MKKFNAGEWVILMLAFSVGATILIGVLGIVFKGSVDPSDGATAVRTALIDLLKFICGGIFGIVATLLSLKKDKDDNGKSIQ